jgi:hypothetical protein
MEPTPLLPPERRRRGVPLVLIGGLGALLAGAVIAWVMVRSDSGSGAAPPASEAGLVIDSSAGDDGRIDPAKPLRCFVQGQFVGELSLTSCALRNGVATDALDVGIDESGALAAADQASQALVPLPPVADEPAAAETPVDPEDAEDPAGSEPGSCWRYGGGRWRKMASDMDVDGCVQLLFAGQCEKPGSAHYGRWGAQTLRRVTGRVEVSDDNRTFRTLAPQGTDCVIAPIG